MKGQKHLKWLVPIFILIVLSIPVFSDLSNEQNIEVELKFTGNDVFIFDSIKAFHDADIPARNQYLHGNGSATVYVPVKFLNEKTTLSDIPATLKEFIFNHEEEIVPGSEKIYTVVSMDDISNWENDTRCNYDNKTDTEKCVNITRLINNNTYRYTLKPYTTDKIPWSNDNYLTIVYSYELKNLSSAVNKRLKFSNSHFDPTSVTMCGTLNTQDETYTLTQNINSTDTCLVIANTGITLDCDGYTIEYANVSTGQGIELSGSADNTTIKNCIIRQVNASVQDSAGIYTNGGDCDNLNVTNNTFNIACEDCDGVNILTAGKTNMSFSYNNFTHGDQASNSHGIIMRSDFGYIYNNTFYIDQAGSSAGAISLQSGSNNNTIFNNNVIYTNFFGFYIDSSGDLIYNNTINHRRYCILTANDNIMIYNNTCISGNSNTYGIWLGGGTNVHVYENTFDEDIATNVRCIYYRANDAKTVYIYNNEMNCGDAVNINTYATGTTTPMMYMWGNTITATDDCIGGDKQSGIMTLYSENDTFVSCGGYDVSIEDEKIVMSGTSYDKDNVEWLTINENYTNITNREFIRVNVTQSGSPVNGAEVQINTTAGTEYTLFTGADGLTGYVPVTEYIANGTFTYLTYCPIDSNVTCFTPITITVNDSSSSNSTIFNMTGKTTYNLTLSGALPVDSTPPTVTIQTPTNTTYSYVPSLNFTSTDASGIDKCWYTLNGSANTSLASCNNLSTLGGNGWNNLTVYSNDTVGNVGSASVNFTIDTVYPLLTVTNPQNTTYNYNTSLPINYTVYDINLDSCWYKLDSAANVSLTSCSNATFNASEGSHIIIIAINDSAGNTNTTSIGFTIDMTPPVVPTIQSPTNTTYNVTSINLNYTISEGDQCKYELDGSNTTLASCQNTTLSGLSDGLHNVKVWVNDTVNNWNVSSAVYFTVDTSIPSVTIQLPTNTTYYYNTSLPLNFTVSGNIDKIWYWIDAGSSTTITTNITFNISSGSHIMYVRVNDTAGNVNTSSVGFTVNLSGPILNIQLPQNTTYGYNTSLPFNWTAADLDLDKVWYNIDLSSNTTITSNITFNTSRGSHTIYLYANDSLGHNSSTNVSFTVKFTPTVTLVSPVNLYSTTATNITFIFNVTDRISSTLNCSLLIGGISLATNDSVTNNTNTNFSYILSTGTGQTWGINCTNDDNNSDYKTRTISIGTITAPGTPGGRITYPRCEIDYDCKKNETCAENGFCEYYEKEKSPFDKFLDMVYYPCTVFPGNNICRMVGDTFQYWWSIWLIIIIIIVVLISIIIRHYRKKKNT